MIEMGIHDSQMFQRLGRDPGGTDKGAVADHQVFKTRAAREIEEGVIQASVSELYPRQMPGDEGQVLHVEPVVVPVAVAAAVADTEPEPPEVAPDGVADPDVDVARVGIVPQPEGELAGVERRVAAEEENVVGEVPELPRQQGERHPGRVGGGDDAQARGTLPEAAPAPRQDGRAHRLPCREEGEEVVDEVVGEAREGVVSCGGGARGESRFLFLGRFPRRRHSVEHAAGGALSAWPPPCGCGTKGG